jgi:hypothetical protein
MQNTEVLVECALHLQNIEIRSVNVHSSIFCRLISTYSNSTSRTYSLAYCLTVDLLLLGCSKPIIVFRCVMPGNSSHYMRKSVHGVLSLMSEDDISLSLHRSPFKSPGHWLWCSPKLETSTEQLPTAAKQQRLPTQTH